MNLSVILLAGGFGARMRQVMPKQYLTLGDKPMARHSFDLFASMPEVSEIVVVCGTEYQTHFQGSEKAVKFAPPGERRQDSVAHGLQEVSSQATLVAVHDSARPMITADVVRAIIAEAEVHGAAIAAVPLSYTVKQSDDRQFVQKTLDRSALWEIQTPQVMRPALLRQGMARAQQEGLTVTDCSALIELISHPVKLVKGSSSNIKVTTPSDLVVAEMLLGQTALV